VGAQPPDGGCLLPCAMDVVENGDAQWH
jgi:hypothetical protein